MRLRYAEGATFWVNAAFDEVWLTYVAPLTPADAAYFLLEPVTAFVLRCRGTLVLHASAVDFEGRSVLFCGPGGAGKSTAAAACVAAGGALLSDDVVALEERGTESGTVWVAHPGTTSLRLWDDGARALLGESNRAPRFSTTWEKRVVRPTAVGGRHSESPARVALICVLAERDSGGASPRLEPLAGQAALASLIPNTSANYLHDAVRRAQELAQLARLLAAVPTVRLIAHREPDRIGEMVRLVRERLHA